MAASLKEQMGARKLAKRTRLQELLAGERLHSRRSRFAFKALPFDTDPDEFERCGGREARQRLVPGIYCPEPSVEELCLNLIAPQDFTFQTNLDGVLRFVYELRRQAFIERRYSNPPDGEPRLYLNLDQINRVDLAGALILAAELDRIRKVIGFKPMLDDHKWDPNIRQTLLDLGVHEIIEASTRRKGLAAPKSGAGLERFQVVKLRSGASSSNELAKALRDELFEACRPFSVARPQVMSGLEALTTGLRSFQRERKVKLSSDLDGWLVELRDQLTSGEFQTHDRVADFPRLQAVAGQISRMRYRVFEERLKRM